ncbi:MAG: isoprenylcysteine carboxylmethyltransferase family protein [Bryobacteraceae bacterium]
MQSITASRFRCAQGQSALPRCSVDAQLLVSQVICRYRRKAPRTQRLHSRRSLFWLANPHWQSLAAGIPISILGLALRAWAAGHLAKNQTLATGGPYAYTRNPLYLGTLLVAAGVAVASQRIELVLLFGFIFAFVYLPVIELEEQHLRKLFPDYAAYAGRVPILLPKGRRLTTTEPFQPQLYLRNEEYQALLGYLTGLAILIWKAA